MGGRTVFDSEQLATIARAVAEAEERTSGEIVTYVVGECDAYPEAAWKAAALGGLLALGISSGIALATATWGIDLVSWGLVPASAGTAVGWVLGRTLSPLRRLLADRRAMDRRFRLRAEAAFLEEEVFKTRDRSGILIFLALFERRALVLGDEGIHRAVEQQEWEGIVADLVTGIRAGRLSEALVGAVERCGRLLEERGVAIRPDDENELANAPRMRDR